MMPAGICGVISSSISPARSSSVLTPSARHIRSSDPNTFVATGMSKPVGLLEQQRRPAARRLAGAIGDGRDLEVRADRFADARQQAALVEIGEEVVEVGVHRC